MSCHFHKTSHLIKRKVIEIIKENFSTGTPKWIRYYLGHFDEEGKIEWDTDNYPYASIGMNASRAYTLLLQQKGVHEVFSTGRVQLYPLKSWEKIKISIRISIVSISS